MNAEINGSVGMHGKNNVDDVVIVQNLLLQQGLAIGRLDGKCGSRTIAGIITFQSGFLRQPDGLVEPGGKTFQRLNMVAFKPAKSSKIAPKHTPQSEIKKAVPSEVVDTITRLVRRSSLGVLNPGVTAVSNSFMLEKLGSPRETYTADCQQMTNVKLKKHIQTASVGPFKVTGLKPAVESLQKIMKEISERHSDIYAVLGTAGMLCCRYQRDSTTDISNHSWGSAIDLTLKGILDKRGNGMVQQGLAVIAPIFNSNGWYWGAGFNREDAMHFEVGRKLMEQWLPGLK